MLNMKEETIFSQNAQHLTRRGFRVSPAPIYKFVVCLFRISSLESDFLRTDSKTSRFEPKRPAIAKVCIDNAFGDFELILPKRRAETSLAICTLNQVQNLVCCKLTPAANLLVCRRPQR